MTFNQAKALIQARWLEMDKADMKVKIESGEAMGFIFLIDGKKQEWKYEDVDGWLKCRNAIESLGFRLRNEVFWKSDDSNDITREYLIRQEWTQVVEEPGLIVFEKISGDRKQMMYWENVNPEMV